MRNGVPFEIAFALDVAERTEWVVALGTLSGRQYDWASGTWDEVA